jgi:hypothetical protein
MSLHLMISADKCMKIWNQNYTQNLHIYPYLNVNLHTFMTTHPLDQENRALPGSWLDNPGNLADMIHVDFLIFNLV